MAAKRSSSRASSRARRAPAGKQPARKKKAPKKAPVKATRKAPAKTKKTAAKKAPKKAPAAKRRSAHGSKSRTESQVEQIQRVIDVMVAAGAVEVELEEAGSKLRVRLKEERPVMTVAAAPEPRAHAPSLHDLSRVVGPGHDVEGALAGDVPAEGEVFASPMVGTFYRSPSPDAEPFVKEGDMVTADTVLCIIEAMKVMNEIKAEMDGQIVEIAAQNGEPVEYGQPLFTIKT